jgi:glyoxylase-like metal-dependent hydrolase (beta-lactamase superfamily II)
MDTCQAQNDGVQISPSLHRLGNGTVNAYLVEDGGEVTIVDAGLPGFWGDLPAELAAMGRSLDDVRAMVLTHGHSDHLGFAERFRVDRHITPRIHELDAAMARGELKPQGQQSGKMRIGSLVGFMLFGIRKGALRQKALTEVATFGDGVTLDVPGAPRVIHLPGHSPGSAALHFPSHDALLVGDAIATLAVTSGHVGPQIAPFTADPDEALASLSKIEGESARWVLPGHGDPWTGGVGEAVAAVRTRVGSGVPVG